MSNASSIGLTCLVVAGFATILPLLQADDQPAPAANQDGYKTVPIVGANGQRANIRVLEQPRQDPRLTSSASDGKYDPNQINLGKTSSLSNKTFSDASYTAADKTDTSLTERGFVTKSYFSATDSSANQTAAGFDTKVSNPAAGSDFNRSASLLDKNYTTGAGQPNVAQNKAATFTAGAAEEQNRTAQLGTDKVNTQFAPMNDKPYLGHEADLVKNSLAQMNQGLMQVKDLPNRPLSIDEVRALLNHGIKPNTDAPPPEPTKPLNDPDYKPDPPPAPLAPDTSFGDLPPPGTIATQQQPQQAPPENSEPLPNK